MFIDKLLMFVPAKCHAKIIIRTDRTLQLNTIHKENGDRNIAFATCIKEYVLYILRLFRGHFAVSFLIIRNYFFNFSANIQLSHMAFILGKAKKFPPNKDLEQKTQVF